MKIQFIVLILVLTCTSINAQDIYEVEKENNKIVYGMSLKLFLGDTILVETTVEDNSIKEFKIVKTLTDSSRTIIIEFKFDYFSSQKASLLKTMNPFEKTLDFKAEIKPFNKRIYYETSIIPIFPGISCVEMWPYKIESIILSNFTIE